MGIARDRADRKGTTPIQIGDTKLATDGSDNLSVTNASGTPKKLIASEIEIGDSSNKVIIKKGSDNKVAFETQASGGSATASNAGGTAVYADISAMTAVTASAGDQAYVTANKSLYINNGNGWYKISTVNTTPTISAPSNNATIALSTSGVATSIEITAADVDEGTTIQYSYAATTGSLTNIAAVTSCATSNGTYTSLAASTNTAHRFFKVTPVTSPTTGGSVSLTWSASDTISAATVVQNFTLTFSVNASATFDGTNDKVTMGASNDFDTTDGAWTLECWVNFDSFVGGDDWWTPILEFFNSHQNNKKFYVSWDGGGTPRRMALFCNGGGSGQVTISGTTALATGTWYHMCWQRNASHVWKMYLNGQQEATGTESAQTSNASWPPSIGLNEAYDDWLDGKISNMRIVKGSEVYTAPGGYNYGNSAAFPGAGSNADTISVAGDCITGNTWTIEAWIYYTADQGSGSYWFSQGTSGNAGRVSVGVDDTDKFWGQVGGSYHTSSGTISLNTWYHVALCHDGTTLRTFVDGALIGSSSTTQTADTSDGNGMIGGLDWAGGYEVHGNISNLRIVNGTALYTSAFTSPTSSLTKVTNTTLLTCQTGSGAQTDASDDSRALTISGSVAASTSGPFLYSFTPPTANLSAISGTVLLAFNDPSTIEDDSDSNHTMTVSGAVASSTGPF